MASRRARDAVLEKIVAAAVDAPEVTALWLEGPSLAAARDPKGPFDLHLAVPDPDFDLFARGHESFLRAGGVLASHEDDRAAADGWFCRVRFPEGVSAAVMIERQSLLAKRLRRAVVPLVDKTWGGLRSVMAFAAGHEMGA